MSFLFLKALIVLKAFLTHLRALYPLVCTSAILAHSALGAEGWEGSSHAINEHTFVHTSEENCSSIRKKMEEASARITHL